MKRKIIEINEELCNGCGNCVTGCSEGALKIIEGKAKVVNDKFCDGFGDCIGHCPTGALKIVERETIEFDQNAVEDHLRKNFGEEAVVKMKDAQMKHSQNHSGGDGKSHGGNDSQQQQQHHQHNHGGCPSARFMNLNNTKNSSAAGSNENPEGSGAPGIINSELRHWPVQLHLVSPQHPAFKDCDLLMAADCVAFTFADFHRKLLKGKTLAIACPKLDDTDGYVEKLAEIFKYNNIKSVTCAVMEVPCCNGLLRIVKTALASSGASIPLKTITIGVDGSIKDISI